MFDRFRSAQGVTWLVVFLGNPGTKFNGTRHNAGFMAADAMAKELNVSINKLRFKALTAQVEIGGAKEVYACASHGVLSGPAIDRINDSTIKELLLLDTIPYPADRQPSDKIRYMSVAPVFAEAIQRVYEEMSISNLFE